LKDEKVPSSVEEQRRDLDRRVKAYMDHAKAYYGALRKKEIRDAFDNLLS
jgi:hypothetical protein